MAWNLFLTKNFIILRYLKIDNLLEISLNCITFGDKSSNTLKLNFGSKQMEDNIIRPKVSPYYIPDVSVGTYIWNRLQELNDHKTCLIEESGGSRLILSDLLSKSNGIAMGLIDMGVTKSDLIVTFANNSIDYAIVLFASIWLGVTLYPVTPIANIYDLEVLLKSLDSFVFIISQSKVEIMERVLKKQNQLKLKDVIVLDGNTDKYKTFDNLVEAGNNRKLPQIPYFKVDPLKDLFVLLQSSGTSGVPKSVMISHRAFLSTILNFMTSKIVENPVTAHVTPFGCISGVTFLFSYIPLGIPIVIYNQFSEQLILESIPKYKVSFMYFTPIFGYKLIDEEVLNKYDLSSLKHLFTGGSALPENVGTAIVRKHNVVLNECYGMTEYFPITSAPTADALEYIPKNMGTVAPNTEIKIIDIKTGQSLGPNKEGELCVRGPKMFSGYLFNTSATNEAIDNEGWLHSGDIAYYDKNHCFYITDRLKELIKYQTKAVSPSELEQFLLTHKCVAEVAVVGVKHVKDNQWPRAYVKLKPNTSVTEEELKNYVSDNLNFAKQLRAGVVFVDTIPRTTIGKVDRRYFKSLIANEVIQ